MSNNGRDLSRASWLGVALALALSPAVAGPPAESPAEPAPDAVVLIGRYSCNAITYTVLNEPPTTLLDHSIAFSGTGWQVASGPTPGPAFIGPGFGGRKDPGGAPRPPDPPTTPISNLGLTTTVNLGEGTGEQ